MIPEGNPAVFLFVVVVMCCLCLLVVIFSMACSCLLMSPGAYGYRVFAGGYPNRVSHTIIAPVAHVLRSMEEEVHNTCHATNDNTKQT